MCCEPLSQCMLCGYIGLWTVDHVNEQKLQIKAIVQFLDAIDNDQMQEKERKAGEEPTVSIARVNNAFVTQRPPQPALFTPHQSASIKLLTTSPHHLKIDTISAHPPSPHPSPTPSSHNSPHPPPTQADTSSHSQSHHQTTSADEPWEQNTPAQGVAASSP